VDNRNGTLLPGAYVRVHLKLPQSANSVTVPSNTLLFRSEGLRVGVVRNGRAELVPVTIGRDYGNSVEVVSGLQPTDPVIVNPSDSLISGTTVQVNAPLLRPPRDEVVSLRSYRGCGVAVWRLHGGT
jgi:multidrug efflux pump subunit AcrA (membrane-fusion protein)